MCGVGQSWPVPCRPRQRFSCPSCGEVSSVQSGHGNSPWTTCVSITGSPSDCRGAGFVFMSPPLECVFGVELFGAGRLCGKKLLVRFSATLPATWDGVLRSHAVTPAGACVPGLHRDRALYGHDLSSVADRYAITYIKKKQPNPLWRRSGAPSD